MDAPSTPTFSLRAHPRRLEIAALALDIERQGELRSRAVLLALRELGLVEDAQVLQAELGAE